MIKINEYLDALPGAKAIGKIGETELTDIIVNSMSNGWIRQVYVQGFDCVYIALKNL